METKSSYKERLQQSPEEKDQKALDYQVKRAEQQLAADILETESAVDDAEQALEEAKSAVPFNTQAIINAQVALETAKDGLKRAKALKAELFGK